MARILQLLRKGRSIASTNPTANPASPVTAGPVFASALPPGSALINSCATPTRGAARSRKTAAPATPPAPRANTADPMVAARSEKACVKPVRAPANAAAQTTCVSRAAPAAWTAATTPTPALPARSAGPSRMRRNASRRLATAPSPAAAVAPPRIVRRATPATMASAKPAARATPTVRRSGAASTVFVAPARCETDQECPQGTICQSAAVPPRLLG